MQKKYKSALAAGLTCLSLALPLVTDMPAACAAEEEKAQTEQKKEKKAERFKLILSDMTFKYYMDMETARWVTIPHGAEKIIEVWIKLIPDAEAMAEAGEYSYPQKYFLEHYLIRPQSQQIQFLAELEITGHPMNDVDTGTYRASAWETLVPESIEDKIYHAVVKNIGKAKNASKSKGGVNDFLFHAFRIGL